MWILTRNAVFNVSLIFTGNVAHSQVKNKLALWGIFYEKKKNDNSSKFSLKVSFLGLVFFEI